ncbi:MAG TPA: metal-dependent hydrolase [Candidatus Fusicatenibacter merdavium]|uniref:Metal-dependent hydrolase n=1 Tax=Candidatus Fusicatenibacter merdavium TaxID=2838600 RepID=A0A9D1XDD8_9FIRM|nr:metal-dependent hydrolase [Candidatus Fusicatenibacter merdavium]
MTGKTHWAVGTAAALCLGQPANFREWVLCVGAAAVGSVICDVDVTTSDSRETLNRITVVAVLVAVAVGAAEAWWHLGIVRNFERESNLFRLIVGFAAFLAVCTFGKNQPHRSFMHSFAGWFLLGGITGLIYPAMTPYFSIAMLSHMAIDLLNRRNVRLLYPLKKGFSFRVCSADGLVNHVLFLAGAAVSAAASLLMFFFRYREEVLRLIAR